MAQESIFQARETSDTKSDIKPTKRPRMSLDMFGEGYLSCQESKSGNIERLLLRFVVEKRQWKILCKLFTSPGQSSHLAAIHGDTPLEVEIGPALAGPLAHRPCRTN